MATLEHYALVIGVGGDLPRTVDDAVGIGEKLADPSRCAFAHVKVLKAEEANRKGILDALDDLAKKAPPESTVVVFFSGHGSVVASDYGDSYWLMPNGYVSTQLKNTAINGNEFATKLNAIRAERLLLLLDCCHAQGIAASEAKEAKFVPSPLPDVIQAQFRQGKGRVLLSSCKSGQVSWMGKPYSLFTRAIIEALCGANLEGKQGDRFVRVMDLASYAGRMVPEWSKERIKPQHPEIDLESADNFKVAYYAGGEEAPKSLDLPPMTPERAEKDHNELLQQVTLSTTYSATLNGDGAIAQGTGAIGIGAGGVYVGGKNSGSINTGTIDTGGNVRTGRDFVGRDLVNGSNNLSGSSLIADTMIFNSADVAKSQQQSQEWKEKAIRLDVSAPSQVYVGQSFLVAAALRFPSSDQTSVGGMPTLATTSGKAKYQGSNRLVDYIIKIDATNCNIEGDKEQKISIRIGKESDPCYFVLTPKGRGAIILVVKAHQTDQAVAASVPLQLQAILHPSNTE